MSTTTPDSRTLDAFRDRADRFIADLDEELYLHYSGQKETFDVEQIYERYEDLTSVETAQSLAGAPTELWRFACEGFLGNLTREHQARTAQIEASLEATVDGETIPYRMLRVVMSNEPDREKRRRLEETRLRLLDEQLNPVYLEAVEIDREAVKQLGQPNYYELYKNFGFRLDSLADECRSVLDETEKLWEREGERLFRSRLGIGLSDARPWDVGRLFRAPELDQLYPQDRMVPALEATLTELGIDLRSQQNVHLDLELRPSKSPRPFCAPIEVPGRVMLVLQPNGGKDDWEALFHEAGHTEHFAHTSPSLSMEEKRLGDNAVTEGWAMLLEHLTIDPVWLQTRIDFARPHEFAAEGATQLLWLVRRYCAKLLYEIEYHATPDVTVMRSRYVELLGGALKVMPSDTDYLADIDDGFYSSQYLRAWAFEAQLRAFLREKFGNAWFTRKDAGSLIRDLWTEGQKPTADEMLMEVTGSRIDMEAVADRIREALAAG